MLKRFIATDSQILLYMADLERLALPEFTTDMIDACRRAIGLPLRDGSEGSYAPCNTSRDHVSRAMERRARMMLGSSEF